MSQETLVPLHERGFAPHLRNGTMTPDDTADYRQPEAAAAPLSVAQSAHDLANFLTGIRMLAQSLSQLSPDDQAVQQHIESLHCAALHASELCGHLRNALADQPPGSQLELRAIDIGVMVREMNPLLTAILRGDTELKIETDADAGSPSILGNPTQLRQVVLDLVTNAAEALPNRQGTITIRTGVANAGPARDDTTTDPAEMGMSGAGSFTTGEFAQDAEGAYLEIADNGCGIAADQLQRIFEPAFSTKPSGQGLGLAAVLRIVRGCRGAVSVHSRLGIGTTIRCLFPVATQRLGQPSTHSISIIRSRQTAAPGRDDPAEQAMCPITILLIEDDAGLRYLAKSLIEASDKIQATVLAAGEGHEAMEIFQRRQNEISVVILDMELPDCRGTQLIHQIRTLAPGMPIILASGTPEQELIAQCQGCLPDGIVVKPLDAAALIRAVLTALHPSRLQQV